LRARRICTSTRRLHFQRGDHHALLGRDEAEALAVQGLEGCAHVRCVRQQDGQRRIGAVVAQVRPGGDGNDRRLHALGGDPAPVVSARRARNASMLASASAPSGASTDSLAARLGICGASPMP
jgi:hypothetical protein